MGRIMNDKFDIKRWCRAFPLAILLASSGLVVSAVAQQPSDGWYRISDDAEPNYAPVVRADSLHLSGNATRRGANGWVGDTYRQDVQDPIDVDGLDQVPAAPAEGPKPAVGPSLQVASNADPSADRPQQDWCCLGPPRYLFGTRNGLTIGGWTQAGYHNKNLPLFNNRRSELNLHQAWLFAEKCISQPNSYFDINFRTDAVYGIDAQDIQAFGHEPLGDPDGWDNDLDNGAYGWAIPQAYVEIGDGRDSIKFGKFFSIFGYERAAAAENFFYSHSYAYYFTNPFTQTGALATFDRGRVVYTAGVVAGWETGFEQFRDAVSFVGGVSIKKSPNETLAVSVSAGDTGYLDDGYLVTSVYENRLSKQLTFVLQTDRLDTDTVDEYGASGYLVYYFNHCLGVGARTEWWRTDRFTGGEQSVVNWTYGANYRPDANVVIRPEVRFEGGAATANSFDTPVFGIDAILFF